MSETATREAIDAGGGQAAVARHFGISPQAVQQWYEAGRVPAHRVVSLCALINYKFTPYQLRPDAMPPPDGAEAAA